MSNQNWPSYEKLFGALDFKKGDPGRSVYSPGAYLADLLQLMDDNFTSSDLDSRRGDIKELPLNAENAFTLIPYLDIVNRLLEERAKTKGTCAYQVLKEAKYPFNLPFNLTHEKLKKDLHYANVSAETLYKAFALQIDPQVIAREALGLSPEEIEMVTAERQVTLGYLKTYYNFHANDLTPKYIGVKEFMRLTALSGPQLRELIQQDLSETAINKSGSTEQERAAEFFINAGLGGYAKFDEKQENIIWNKKGAVIPVAWFDRVNRFVRLSQKIGVRFKDLDLILRSCCANTLDAAAIEKIAVIRQVHIDREMPLDEVCALWAPLNAMGIGNEDAPTDLFNRLFNNCFAAISKKILIGSGYTHPSFDGLVPLSCNGDILSAGNREYRQRLSKTLQLAEKDLVLAVEKFREQSERMAGKTTILDAGTPFDHKALSLIFRLAKISEMADITMSELFHLFDVLEKDPALRLYSNFNVLIPFSTNQMDCYAAIEGADLTASMWLVQIVLSIGDWMQSSDFTAGEILNIVGNRQKSEEQLKAEAETKVPALDNLYQQFLPVMMGRERLVSERFDMRSARVIYRALSNGANNLLSRVDNRLLNPNPENARAAGYEALAQLATMHRDDFTGLGLSEKMAAKVYNNLLLRGFINLEGRIIEEALPAQPQDFSLSSDFSENAAKTFDIVNALYAEELENSGQSGETTGDDLKVGLELFLSDLEELGLEQQQLAELYDNLIFNGYIDEEGNVLEEGVFADSANADIFEINAPLNEYGSRVYDVISKKIARFENERLTLSPGLFEELGFAGSELDDLMENLRFNDYIDEKNIFLAKGEFLKGGIADFNLALTFYPQRHKIYNAIRRSIEDFKNQFFTLAEGDFSAAADRIISEMIFEQLSQNHLNNETYDGPGHDFFLDQNNLEGFDPGIIFTASDAETIFSAIAGTIVTVQKYRLTHTSLQEPGLDDEDGAELFIMLVEDSFISENGSIVFGQLGYFLNVNNALVFSPEGFEDYAKDIFFTLQAVAVELDAAINEIVNTLQSLAKQQQEILFSNLQEVFELDADVVETVCEHVLRYPDNMVEEWLAPVLSAVDNEGVVSAEPNNRRFNVNYRRIAQYALLANKLGLDKTETDIVFNDQDLADKLPENLVFPKGLQRIDALLHLDVDAATYPELESEERLPLILLFQQNRFWAYAAESYNLVLQNKPISALAPALTKVAVVDAAFTDEAGRTWIISGTDYFSKEAGSDSWEKKIRPFGKVESNFSMPEKIDAAFTDDEGKTYLFAGDQYVRYSENFDKVNEGYPRKIKGNWVKELSFTLPEKFSDGVDASFEDRDGRSFIFKNNHFVSSENYLDEQAISAFWGKVKNNFKGIKKLDSAFAVDNRVYFLSGNQVARYSNSIENYDVKIDEGSIESLLHFPRAFQNGVDAAFKGRDNRAYVFKDKTFIQSEKNSLSFAEESTVHETVKKWGLVRNTIQTSGTVDAAFSGLDGRTYLFSGDQFYRYSGSNYSFTDEGYPLTIASFWGGLKKVQAAFILDGKTYLFGEDDKGKKSYIRYSGNDYSIPDDGYPKMPDDNWWNLPLSLVDKNFDTPDAILIGKDGNTYLFHKNRYVCFDARQRWWSEPKELAKTWDSIPFKSVDAAFSGKDGRTYIFSGKEFIRYSDANYNKIDDRFPKKIDASWGKVQNTILKSGIVDAVLVVLSRVAGDNGSKTPIWYTYLFSGKQFFRYSTVEEGSEYSKWVDEGYPKTINKALKNEPRFANLKKVFEDGIDAAFADRRNVYLFTQATCTVVSETAYKEYNDALEENVNCVFEDDGLLFAETGSFDEGGDPAGRWLHLSSVEAMQPTHEPVKLPPLLYDVPPKFQHGLSAVLKGVDGHNYLFNEARCFNTSMEKYYAIGEEWGRVDNNIAVNNSVDAAITGSDGKIYLFSGDQFVAYTMPDQASIDNKLYIDDHPKPISEHWKGLNKVDIAFTREGKTFLFEKLADGNYNYLCYSGKDYGKADPGYPKTTDMSWWGIPEMYIEEGFTEVDAVFCEDENMFLFRDREFIQYNSEEGLWTYPRPVDLVWKGIPFNEHSFSQIKTLFMASNGVLHFFSEESSCAYSDGIFSPIQSIKNSWGLVKNNIAEQNRVDAAFVFDKKTTYLFSGEQYVRYSTGDYRFVDTGYPKPIAGNLLKEEAFKNMPDALEEAITSNGVVDAVVSNEGNVYLFAGMSVHVASQLSERQYDIGRLGHLKNNINRTDKVDAALADRNGSIFLFCGDQVFKYDDGNYDFVKEGYPRNLLHNNEQFPQWTSMDAAFFANGSKDTVYFFKGDSYCSSADLIRRSGIAGKWGKAKNTFYVNDKSNVAIDAAFIAADGNFYVFKGGQYIRYSHSENEFVDEGFPKDIRDNWGNLPAEFEESIEGGFMFENRTYLLKGDQYVRYSRLDLHVIDSIYPQKFSNRWAAWNDFMLSDLKTISRFKQFQESYGSGDYTLVDFFDDASGTKPEPYKMLAEIFDWDIDDLKWLKSKNAFLAMDTTFEKRFNLELVLTIFDQLALARKMGSNAENLYYSVWTNLYATNKPDAAIQELYQLLGLNNSSKDWQVLKKQMHDEMNILKNNALVPYLIQKLNAQPGNEEDPAVFIEDTRDLYQYLLVDVEMSECAETSKIKEALSTVQLYFHRYFLNLENLSLNGDSNNVGREQLKEMWKWMKNYRVWEANRKVFLYPENYIRPELRDTKSPEFKNLEEALLQGELTRDIVTTRFKEYLDDFATIGNLRVAGANVYKNENDNKVLILFGHTRFEPLKYYYRTAEFGKDSITWTPWEKIDITINSTRVFPIHAFGRIMVFWIEIDEREETEAKLMEKEKGSAEVNTSRKKLKHLVNIKYAFYNYTKKWSTPQTLKDDIPLNYEIDAAFVEDDELITFAGKYCLKTSQKQPTGAVKPIKQYTDLGFDKLPSTFQNGVDAATAFNNKRYFFRGGECYIQHTKLQNDKRVVDSSKSDEHKQIRHLIEEPENNIRLIVVAGPFGIAYPHVTEASAEPIPTDGFDACFELKNGVLCLVDKKGAYSFYLEKNVKGKIQLSPIRSLETIDASIGNFGIFISTIANKGGQFAPADAVFKQKEIFYVLRDGEYECYDGSGNDLIPLDGFPKPIKGNLAFNMDKFFNKLHVTNSTDGKNLELTYMTPQEKLLLSGKLMPDFHFEETEVKSNLSYYLLAHWDYFVSRNLNDYQDSALNTAVTTGLNTLKSDVTTLENSGNTLKSIDGILTEMKRAAGHADILLSNAGKEAKKKAEKDLNASVKKAKDAFAAISRNSEYAGFIKSLKSSLTNLEKSIEYYTKGDLDRFKHSIQATLEEIKEFEKDVEAKFNKLKSTTKQKREEYAKNKSTELARNHTDHGQIAYRFSYFLYAINYYKQVWERSESTTITLKKYTHGNTQLKSYQDENNRVVSEKDKALTALANAEKTTSLNTFATELSNAGSNIADAVKAASNRAAKKSAVDSSRAEILEEFADIVNGIKESKFGRFDIFDESFEITNTYNFTFSEPDWYVFEALGGTFLARPTTLTEKGHYEIIRLTTTVIPQLTTVLFTQGIKGLLSTQTQRIDDSPGFIPKGRNAQNGTAISYDSSRFSKVPSANTLDFEGANAGYYWEIFFHAPFLIAQALNTAQKFEEAREWYEFIYDPTETSYWKFYPFTIADDTKSIATQVKRYLDDPFDPHAIAGLRPVAYRKSILMNYIDNILDWGDMLFRQYTMESINEARMLYILAYDLLGKKPESLGSKILSQPLSSYSDLINPTGQYEFLLDSGKTGDRSTAAAISIEALLEIENSLDATVMDAIDELPPTVNDTVVSGYFFVPENELFLEYWDRVEDRLYKIRHCLNIMGIKQPLPLFQPPIDPMALVQAIGGGASIGQVVSGMAVSVPHYRYSFIINKAKELVQKLNQFSNELLSTLEKRDAEELSIMQTRQEAVILSMMKEIKNAQLDESIENINSLKVSMSGAKQRLDHYNKLIESGLSLAEILQIAYMLTAYFSHMGSVALKIGSGIAHLAPSATAGPFSLGMTMGGPQLGDALGGASEALQSLGEGLSIAGEVFGVTAQHQRMTEDWQLQKQIADNEIKQIDAQIAGAEWQMKAAEQEIAMHKKEVEHNESIKVFMKDKFSNQQLYQWMMSKLSGLYFQTYKLALDLAKSAEKAFQFERGLKESDVNFIQPVYWESQRKGLLAGDALGLDLDRMEKAYIESNQRRLEISRNISLIELDPVALLQLKSKGSCEFYLGEALYDYDFQGHYCRQVKTISVTFVTDEGPVVNATLTQLNHKTILEPDVKAVKYLLSPKDTPPLSIRSDWRASQQIILSHTDEYEKNNGLFELRYDSERYLPFEGTGAISTWRLELNGKKGTFNSKELRDVIINVKYTAQQGGEAFANGVKGLLKPYQASVFFDIAQEFPNEWNQFVGNGSDELALTFTREQFPNMSSSKIAGIFTKYEMVNGGQVSMVLNGDDEMSLKDGRYLDTSGLAISSRGSQLSFKLKGNKASLNNINFVFSYKASVV